MKKVLIITYYWPPSAGSGVQRWVKFAKYLPKFGWEPLIFTPENPDFQVKDKTLDKDISPEIEVIKFPIWEPYQIQRALFRKSESYKASEPLEKEKKGVLDHLAIWIRGNLLIPDPKVFWVRPSVKFLSEIIKTNNIDVVITTGPPHSLHLIGLRLKEKTDVQWIADFRDPWSKWDLLDALYLTPLVKAWHKKLEKSVFKSANKIITISNTFKKEFEELYSRDVELITNGFDPDDFNSAKGVEPHQKFRISHIGTIDELRDPRPFLHAVKALIATDHQFAADLEILFVGVVSGKLMREVQNDVVLNQVVSFEKYVPHEEVFNIYKQSAVLLLVLANSKNAVGNIPGKLFEYMASGRFILALGAPEGDSANIIFEAKAGEVSAPEDKEKIKQDLKYSYNRWKKNEDIPVGNIQSFTREALTKKLAQLLDQSLV